MGVCSSSPSLPPAYKPDNHVFAPTKTRDEAVAATSPFMLRKLDRLWDFFDVKNNGVVTKEDFALIEANLAADPASTPAVSYTHLTLPTTPYV